MLTKRILPPIQTRPSYLYIVTDLITAVVRLLRRDLNGLVEAALGELEPVEPWDEG